MTVPRIGITFGDPGGIGPEVVLKAFAPKADLPQASFILFGSKRLLEETGRALNLKLDIPCLKSFKNSDLPPCSLYEIPYPLGPVKMGKASRENGEASFSYFQAAFEEARKGRIHALVTSPISKHSWNLAGIRWAGHTEYISRFFPKAIMAFWSEKLKVALFTHHLSLKESLKRVKKNSLVDFFLELYRSTEKFFPDTYRIFVAGLNPHAGEEGLLGSEETEIIIPAVRIAQKSGVPISGPYPPDGIFRKVLNRPDILAVSLYHDQGLIPFKLLDFERGVNVTLGLPFVRTSPDHGTAFDIAGQGKANPQSMMEAIKLACSFLSFRKL